MTATMLPAGEIDWSLSLGTTILLYVGGFLTGVAIAGGIWTLATRYDHPFIAIGILGFTFIGIGIVRVLMNPRRFPQYPIMSEVPHDPR